MLWYSVEKKMKEDIHDRVKKIKNGLFGPFDVLEFDFIFEKMMDKKFEEDLEGLVKTDFLEDLVSTLKTGEMWKFNPTNIILFVKNNRFEYNRTVLEESVLEIGSIDHQEIDRNSNLYTLSYPLELLIVNASQIESELIIKSEYAEIRTMSGKVEI